MLNNFLPGFSSGKTNLNNNVPLTGHGVDSVSSGQNLHYTAHGNFKNMLNLASDKGSLSGEGEPVKNKSGDKNNKHNNFSFVLYINSPLHTDKKQSRVILSSNSNSKDSGSDMKGNEAFNGDINALQGNKKSTQNLNNLNNKNNSLGENNTLSKSKTVSINKNDNKKIDGNANIAGTQTNQSRKSNLSLLKLKQALDDLINPQVNTTDNIDNMLSKKRANNFQNNKELNNSNKITGDKKNINSDAITGNDDIKNGIGSNINIKLKRTLANALDLTVIQNYEKRSDSTHLITKSDNNLTINKSVDFLNNTGLSNSNSGNLSGNNTGLNIGIGNGQVNALNAANKESSGSIAINSVLFMIKKNIQSAVITLKPPSLGSVKVEIALKNMESNFNNITDTGKEITINMFAQNDAAKNILQSSSSNLQNALKGQGFSSINLNINLGSGSNNQNGSPFSFLKNSAASLVSGDKKSGVNSSSLSVNMANYYNPNAIIDYFI